MSENTINTEEQQTVPKTTAEAKREEERKMRFAEALTEHITIGSKEAERIDSVVLMIKLVISAFLFFILVLAVVLLMGAIPIKSKLLVVLLFILAMGSAAASLYLVKFIHSSNGEMVNQARRYRIKNRPYPASVTVTIEDDDNNKAVHNYMCVENVFVFPEKNLLIIKTITTDPTEFYDKDKKITKSYKYPLDACTFEINSCVSIVHPVIVTQPRAEPTQNIQEQPTTPDKPEPKPKEEKQNTAKTKQTARKQKKDKPAQEQKQEKEQNQHTPSEEEMLRNVVQQSTDDVEFSETEFEEEDEE